MNNKVKFVCISDTHDMLHKMIESNLIPSGDVLIHSGDYSSCGNEESTRKFAGDLSKLPHQIKIIIAGNHDHIAERNSKLLRNILNKFIYLEDEMFVIRGIKIWGSPWTPVPSRLKKKLQDSLGWSFNVHPEVIREKWNLIPDDVDILITHGPPFGILDQGNSGNLGCPELLNILNTKHPKYHIFGHIHEGYGSYSTEKTTFLNCSSVDKNFLPKNSPHVFEMEATGEYTGLLVPQKFGTCSFM